MAVSVLMPRQGQSVETCILGEWYKQKGDPVKVGDILFSYETDKASFEEEAKIEGILLEIFFQAGDEVPVLENVAVIGNIGEQVDEFRPGTAKILEQEKEITNPEVEPIVKKEQPVVVLMEDDQKKVKISPLAKKVAEEKGINYLRIQGTGPQGRIIVRDIEAIVEAYDLVSSLPANSEDFEIKKLTNIRKLISKAMYNSLHNSAQLTHHMSADARNIMALRKKFKKDFEAGNVSQNITINDLVCFAVIKALKKWPQANTHFMGDSLKWFKKVHLGLAVDTERGLMVPAVKNADDLSLEGLSVQLNTVAAQCRQGNINPELLAPEAATFTVSNLGNYGVEMFTPVINLPQTAILGVCTVVPRPKDLGDGVYGFVPMIGLSLTYDHQALDGGEATLFLREIKEQIENI